MVIAFDPQHITVHVSLNRVKLVDLPGLTIPDEIKNKTGYELVSAEALIQLIRARATELQLSAALNKNQLSIAYNQCLTSNNRATQAVALQIAQELGRNLGYLLVTLKRGDEINRVARIEWDDSYWDYWRDICTVWLGGGLVNGNLGKELRYHAQKTVVDASIADFNIHVSRYGSSLPLVGAARHAPVDCDSALLFDFGGTFIKRAIAKYEANTLVELHHLSQIPSRWTTQEFDPQTDAQKLFDYIVSVIIDTWKSSGFTGATVLVSIACYLSDGQPQENQGGPYSQIRLITNNLQSALFEAVSRRIKMPVYLRLLHDGTAAAATYAGSTNTAVLMIGTALGIGFPPIADRNLRCLGANLYEEAHHE